MVDAGAGRGAGHRSALHHCLDGLDEDEARMSLVPSRTTLPGLVKHAVFVEKVWFGEAITGQRRRELGVATTPDRSFILRRDDTIASIQQAHREACADSRQAVARLNLEDTVTGRGSRSVWAIYLHMVRELAQHCGHADILREQVLRAGRLNHPLGRLTSSVASVAVAERTIP